MIRSLFKQLINRKKSNGWLLLALLFVFCLTWYMVDFFFVLAYNQSLISHRDLHNTYYLDITTLPKKHPEYKEAEEDRSLQVDNIYRIINRIKENPDVESVALCFDNSSLPGTGSYNNTTYRNPEDTIKTASVQRIIFAPEEDYFKVFHHTADNEKKNVSVKDFDFGDPSAIIITQIVADQLFPGESPVGKIIEMNYKRPDFPRVQNRVVGVIDDLKRFDYNRPHGVGFFPQRLGDENYGQTRIVIRTRKNTSPNDFIAAFKKEMSAKLRVGNFYLKNIQSGVQVEKNTVYRFGMTNYIRIRTALMTFFLISIILCMLGTFWYRVNIRREEIGIRRAMGSNTGNIRQLFITEGLLLLTLIVPLAMLIEIQFIHAGLIQTLGKSRESYGDFLPDHTILRFLITNAITWLLMAATVVLAIWYPAHSASRIKPVDALRDE